MKNIIKKIIIFLLVLFLCGCSGNYNLTINNDLSIEENLELTIENSNDNYNKSLKIFQNNDISKDNYDVKVVENKVKISYNNKYDSIEDYILNSKVYTQLFDKIQYNKTNNYIDLYINENIKMKNNDTISNGNNLTDLDVIQINITNPYKMNYTNAEFINDNTYTWSINKNDINKKIQIQFKPSIDKFPIKQVVIISLILVVTFILLFNLYRRYKNRQRF